MKADEQRKRPSGDEYERRNRGDRPVQGNRHLASSHTTPQVYVLLHSVVLCVQIVNHTRGDSQVACQVEGETGDNNHL